MNRSVETDLSRLACTQTCSNPSRGEPHSGYITVVNIFGSSESAIGKKNTIHLTFHFKGMLRRDERHDKISL